MSITSLGLLTGLALGIAIVLDGFTGFAVVALLGTIGVLVGRVLDGELDLTSYLSGGRDRLRR